jgi:8-amino-7-oxononanoate synthase
MTMLDFTSSLYLGFRHEARSLHPWSQLTTGRPAVLAEAAGSERVARRLAWLQGCQQATLASSTLHLFWDLFGLLAGERIIIFLDAGIYPIARWGVERAAGRGTPVHNFPHKDAEALGRLVRRRAGARQPVIVADGICTACGCLVPIADYLEVARQVGGWLVIDDTQALGILGTAPGPAAPYGQGGGGSLQYQNITGPEVLVISSLAKGFGAPLAALSASNELIRQFQARSETRVHCSPPSAVDVEAAGHALKLNTEVGDARRSQLAARIQQFRRRLTEAGLRAEGGLFPVQTLKPTPDLDTRRLYERLLKLDVGTVLRRDHNEREPRISFVITAKHQPSDIEQAVNALRQAVTTVPQPQAEYN